MKAFLLVVVFFLTILLCSFPTHYKNLEWDTYGRMTTPDSDTPFSHGSSHFEYAEDKSGPDENVKDIEDDIHSGIVAPDFYQKHHEVGGLGGFLAGVGIDLFITMGMYSLVSAIVIHPQWGILSGLWTLIMIFLYVLGFWLILAYMQDFGGGSVKDPDMVATHFIECIGLFCKHF